MFFEAELRKGNLSCGLVDFEIVDWPVRNPVRLDPDPVLIEFAESLPVDGRVEDPLRGEPFVVWERMAIVEISDWHEEDRGVSILPKDLRGVVEIVLITVVEGDQHCPR